MGASITVELKLQTAEFDEALQEIRAALEPSSQLNVVDELRELLHQLFGLSELFQKLFTFETSVGAAGTSEIVISLNPTDLFRRILIAVKAGDIDGLVVEYAGFHNNPRLLK